MGHGISQRGPSPGQHRGLVLLLASWVSPAFLEGAFESTGISSKCSQGKVPGAVPRFPGRGCLTSCCSIKPGGSGGAGTAHHGQLAGQPLVLSCCPRESAGLGALQGAGVCGGTLRVYGGDGDDELPWAGLWAETSIPSAPQPTYPGSPGRDGLWKPEVLGKTQLMGREVLEKLKMLLLCLATLAGGLPRASSPLVRGGGGSCENSWQGEELAPQGPSAVLQHLWCNRACLASTHQLLRAV